MSLTEFTRIVDITWEQAYWWALWFVVIIGGYTVFVWSSSWTLSRSTFITNVLPKKMDGLISRKDDEIKRLRQRLGGVEIERDNYRDRLLVINNSSAVRGE